MTNRVARVGMAVVVVAMGVGALAWGADVATTAPATTSKAKAPPQPADVPVDRPTMKGWTAHHEALVALAKKGDIDLYFEGDSVTDFWTNASRPAEKSGREIWKKEFGGWKAGNFGISADHTQHVLWRIENGELDGVKPKVIVLMIGTNNNADPVPEIVKGITAIVEKLKEMEPQSKILLLGVFPRAATAEDPLRIKMGQVNEKIAGLDDGKQVKFLDIGAKFLAADGTLSKDLFPDLLHPNAKGYQIWADAIKPQLTEWLGQPGK